MERLITIIGTITGTETSRLLLQLSEDVGGQQYDSLTAEIQFIRPDWATELTMHILISTASNFNESIGFYNLGLTNLLPLDMGITQYTIVGIQAVFYEDVDYIAGSSLDFLRFIPSIKPLSLEPVPPPLVNIVGQLYNEALTNVRYNETNTRILFDTLSGQQKSIPVYGGGGGGAGEAIAMLEAHMVNQLAHQNMTIDGNIR